MSEFRALLCSTLDGPGSLAIGHLPSVELGPNDVRINVTASGVNFPDILVTHGQYQFKPPLPFAPGFEASGTVSEIGSDVTSVSEGDRVFAFLPYGAHAAELVASENSVYPVPDDLDLVAAGGIATAYGTSYHALVDRAHLESGETLLVLGAAGGVGLAAVQLGKALGARVTTPPPTP